MRVQQGYSRNNKPHSRRASSTISGSAAETLTAANITLSQGGGASTVSLSQTGGTGPITIGGMGSFNLVTETSSSVAPATLQSAPAPA